MIAARSRPLLTHHLPALAWAGLVAALLTAPASALPGWGGWFSLGPWLDPHLDKAGHFLLFAVLAALAARSFAAPAPAGWRRPLARRPSTWAAIVAVAYGGVTELLQLAVAGRGAEAGDLAADAAGALAAAALLALRRRRVRAPAWPAAGPARVATPAAGGEPPAARAGRETGAGAAMRAPGTRSPG